MPLLERWYLGESGGRLGGFGCCIGRGKRRVVGTLSERDGVGGDFGIPKGLAEELRKLGVGGGDGGKVNGFETCKGIFQINHGLFGSILELLENKSRPMCC